jgi:cytochrome c oxidase assembly protein subunit 15
LLIQLDSGVRRNDVGGWGQRFPRRLFTIRSGALPMPLLAFAAVLAFAVVLLGAYVRMSDAGLGCPDWPGCFGQVTPWQANASIAAAEATDPSGPVSAAKAWKEMLHRYLAGGLGLCILAIAVLAWRRLPPPRRLVPSLLLGLLLAQALLGMWTVTRQLHPLIVTAHLVGGMSTLALLVWLLARGSDPPRAASSRTATPPWLAGALPFLVLVQIALGGWVAANGAALACPDLPTCQGAWWPDADFAAGFGFAPAHGRVGAALTAMHLTHRLGALVVLFACLLLAARLVPQRPRAALLLAALVCAQFLIGAANVLLRLPLPVTLAHDAGAALLLSCLVWILASQKRRFL